MNTSDDGEKHSVAVPVDTSDGARVRVGTGGRSAHVPPAVARQLQSDALDDVLCRMEAAHGPVDEDEVAVILRRLTA